MDGAAACGAFEKLALGVVGGDGHVEIDLKARDAARRVLGHVLADFDAQAFEGDVFPFRDDAHHGGHASAEGGGDEISGGKGLAAPVVVERRVGVDGVAGRLVGGGAAEAALVGELDANHDGVLVCGGVLGALAGE